MNKKIIFLLILVFLFTGCANNEIKYISKRLNINLDSCKIIESEDSHGGFHGDGQYFAKISCTEIDINDWKELPLSEELQKTVGMHWCDDNGCNDIYEKYNIPKIKNGYYYFYDRHSESTNPKDDTDLNNRNSYNFTEAIYDSDNKIIYFYEADT